MSTFEYLLWIFLIFLPAGIANMTPVLINKVPLINRWRTPLDLGKKYRGIRIFGQNKTWRGLVTGTLAGGIVAVAVNSVPIELYGSTQQAFLTGICIGFGALLGDAVESFFKRQRGVASGDSWFPFDQTDYIVGGLLFGLPFMQLNPFNYAAILVMYFSLHLLSSYVGFLLKLKDKPI